MKCYLLRQPRHDCIVGGLSFGKFQCRTMELPWRNNEPEISAIPEGVYLCGMRLSPKFGLVYHVSGVQGRTDILIHAGNIPANTLGCILVGEDIVDKSGNTFLTQSRRTLQLLHAFTEGKPFTLTIGS